MMTNTADQQQQQYTHKKMVFISIQVTQLVGKFWVDENPTDCIGPEKKRRISPKRREEEKNHYSEAQKLSENQLRISINEIMQHFSQRSCSFLFEG